MSANGSSAPALQRVAVLGPPGSGKSTLARQLGERYGLPVFHLDQLYFGPGWVPVEPDAFRAEVERIAALSAWVIDGNYTATIAPRLATADTVIYLDVPTWLAMARIARRTIASYGHERPEMAAGCPERFEPEFLRFALSWNRTRRARSLAIAEGFARRGIVLRSWRPIRDLSRILDSDP
ncbi:hypothetical protein HCU64_05870 [Methylobacterium sp. C25]|uniref:hypothetical protein n=1 Tax=Methylobacterium sp. C25 TaxID=2721622 RepID=UPI001F483B8F|nr:hypothetical protein [Methylobacterium sp. C25]MCE4223270.1 hypothetical protein [Methylobacterium sp. C25]